MSVKDSGYVKSANLLGAGVFWKTIFHVIPNILPLIITNAAGSLGSVVLMESSMSFLGYGVDPATPSWGYMITQQGKPNMYVAPYLAIWPGLCISLMVFSASMFGDAVRDLLTYHDAERTAFDIINRYMRFADKEVEKRRSEWKTNEKWAYFIGSDRGRLKLTTKPEPYTLTRTLNWISRQVAPTWKVLQQIDSTNGTTYLKDILDHAKLTERHKKLIEQQTTSTEEIINKEE